MPDDARVFLVDAGQVAGKIYECYKRDAEGVAEPDEPRRLVGRIDVEDACEHQRLVGDDPHRLAPDPGEAHDQVGSPPLVDLEEVGIVSDGPYDLPDVVGKLRAFGDYLLDVVLELGRLGGEGVGLLPVVPWDVGEKLLDLAEALLLALREEVGVAGHLGVDLRSAQLLHADLLAEDGLDYLGAGDEHLGSVLDDEDEVCEGRGVDSPSSAGAENDGDLGDHSRRQRVAVEDLAVARQ